MGYNLTEVKEDNLKDIKELAECMRTVQYYNEKGIYAGNHMFMGYQGYGIPSKKEYISFIKDIVDNSSFKLLYSREECCGNKIIAVGLGALTSMANETKTRCGRVMFFWVHPEKRKTTLNNKLYKKLFGWFKKNNCPSVSISFKRHQDSLAKFFFNKGYKVDNMELVGPVEVV